MRKGPYQLHWFRRDLRVVGNPALIEGSKAYDGRVLGIFFFDRKFLSRSDFSHRRFAFFLQALKNLRQELKSAGGDLLMLDMPPLAGFKHLLKQLKENAIDAPAMVTWCRDYEPYVRGRDRELEDFFEEQGLANQSFRDHLIIEPWELKKSDGQFYQVFTPFSQKWLELIKQKSFRERIHNQFLSAKLNLTWKKLFMGKLPLVDTWQDLDDETKKFVDIELPLAGHGPAYQQALEFKNKLTRYKTQRDLMGEMGTSRLSHYFKSGQITTAQVYELYQNKSPVFIKELIWREFYYHLLYHCPWLEHEEMQIKYRAMSWQNNEEHFAAWCAGKTGVPIVDAAMRQLNTTGWMHNRARMIVASFLVKDLLIDWRWGERYFMKMLLDGDLACNNGGWQWAASTGADAQPYFRIFNPFLQSTRFDPEGTYIRRYIPELAHLNKKDIHRISADKRPKDYPSEIVDHKVQRDLAIKLFKHASNLRS